MADVKIILDDCSDGWAFNLRYAKDREVSQRWEILCAAQALLAALCYEIRDACPAVQLLLAARGCHDASPIVPGCICLQTGQVVLSSVCCSLAFLFPVAFDASPVVGVCELLATARAAASIGTIGTLGGAATTSVPGALLLAAVPSTDGDSDKASIEKVLTAYCRIPPRQGLLGVRDRGVATLPLLLPLPSGSSPWRRTEALLCPPEARGRPG